MRELNFMVSGDRRKLVVKEGHPSDDGSARSFTLVYPDARITIWATTELTSKQMQGVIHDALNLANKVTEANLIAMR